MPRPRLLGASRRERKVVSSSGQGEATTEGRRRLRQPRTLELACCPGRRVRAEPLHLPGSLQGFFSKLGQTSVCCTSRGFPVSAAAAPLRAHNTAARPPPWGGEETGCFASRHAGHRDSAPSARPHKPRERATNPPPPTPKERCLRLRLRPRRFLPGRMTEARHWLAGGRRLLGNGVATGPGRARPGERWAAGFLPPPPGSAGWPRRMKLLLLVVAVLWLPVGGGRGHGTWGSGGVADLPPPGPSWQDSSRGARVAAVVSAPPPYRRVPSQPSMQAGPQPSPHRICLRGEVWGGRRPKNPDPPPPRFSLNYTAISRSETTQLSP